jgi:hypothetical protein
MQTAFIDFKQAYDTIPSEQELWQPLQRTRMPPSFLSVTQDMMTLMKIHFEGWREDCSSTP